MTRTWIVALMVVLLSLASFSAGVAGQNGVVTDPNAAQPAADVEIAGPKIAVGALFDYETVAVEVLYRVNVDSAIGVRAVCLTGNLDDALGFMAVTKFGMGDVYQATLDRIFPGNLSLDNLPANPYAELGAGWDIKNSGFLFLAGTGIELFPDRAIRPQVWSEYLVPAGGANTPDGLGEQFRAMFGFVFEF
jgi:hypothetical protein